MIENLTDVVSTVGFPIAVVIYLLWERQSMSKEMLKTKYVKGDAKNTKTS